MSRRIPVLALIAVAVGAMSVVLTRAFAQQTATPFTVQFVRVLRGPDGNEGFREIASLTARQDASTVETRESVNGERAMIRKVTDLPVRRRIVVDPLTSSTTTTLLSQGDFEILAESARSCANLTPTDKVLGVAVAHRITERKVRDKVVRFEEWVAPSLRCYPLRSISSTISEGKTISSTTVEPISVVVGRADDAAFLIPGNYTERTPGNVLKEFAKLKGEPCPDCVKQSFDSIPKGR